MLVLSIILVCIASGFTLITSFMKDMRKILICIVIASVTTAVNYFVSNSSGGFASYIIATAVAVTGSIFAVKQRKVPLFVIILYCLAYIAANVAANMVKFEGWHTLFAVFGAITGVICNTREDGMAYRIWVLANSILWVCYDIFACAYGPLAQHLLFTAVFAVGLGMDIFKTIKEKKQNGSSISND